MSDGDVLGGAGPPSPLTGFRDRADAGRHLAALLSGRDLVDPVVLALPRGGVPVAFEVATRLGAPLDVFVARKVGAPDRPELGIGAIAEGGEAVADIDLAQSVAVDRARFEVLARAERPELERRVGLYRAGRPLPRLAGRDVVLVDDGLATGVTATAALRALRSHRPRSVVLAVPVCAQGTLERVRALADDVVCPLVPAEFGAVGAWYDEFDQTTDAEVLDLLARPAGRGQPS